jgi:hypothetical protein
MKHSTLVLGIIAAGCGAASIYLGSELSATREELAQQVIGRSADQARIRQLEGERNRFEPASNTVAMSPGTPAPAAPPPVPPNPAVANSMGPGSMPPVPRGERANDIRNTPAGENNRRLQQEIRLRRMYADMPEALGLDATQADKLFDLLADSRVSSFDDAAAYRGDPQARQSLEAAARRQRDAEIDALLGPDKAAEFQTFEKSIPARMQVNRIGENMAAANVPLSDAQRNSMIAAVFTEQQAAPAPERIPNPDPAYEARFIDWQIDYSRRVQARVEPLLSAEQLARYREALEVQNARRAEQRARVEARRNAPPGRQ